MRLIDRLKAGGGYRTFEPKPETVAAALETIDRIRQNAPAAAPVQSDLAELEAILRSPSPADGERAVSLADLIRDWCSVQAPTKDIDKPLTGKPLQAELLAVFDGDTKR